MISRLANPKRFMRVSGAALPALAVMTPLVLLVGLYIALFVAPPDYQQGESVRIMYVHVPAAIMAEGVYYFVVAASFVALVWRHPLAEIGGQAAAPLGAAFTLVCLVTGYAVGPADVGHVVGVGRPADVGPGAVFSVSRLYRAGQRV